MGVKNPQLCMCRHCSLLLYKYMPDPASVRKQGQPVKTSLHHDYAKISSHCPFSNFLFIITGFFNCLAFVHWLIIGSLVWMELVLPG